MGESNVYCGVYSRPISVLKLSKDPLSIKLQHSLTFCIVKLFLRRGGQLETRLLECYVVLWIHDIDTICNFKDNSYLFDTVFWANDRRASRLSAVDLETTWSTQTGFKRKIFSILKEGLSKEMNFSNFVALEIVGLVFIRKEAWLTFYLLRNALNKLYKWSKYCLLFTEETVWFQLKCNFCNNYWSANSH